jgi:hypothetical protein
MSVLMSNVVKVRSRSGTKSLELTIPVSLIKENNISEGDLFEVECNNAMGKTLITYRLIYKSN